jgi:hypothetical protein
VFLLRLPSYFADPTPMKTISIGLLVATSVCSLPAPSRAGQAQPDETPPTLNVCEVLSAPLKYNGRIVTIRGRSSGTDEGYWVYSDDCPGALTTGGFTWPSEVSLALPTLPLPLRLHPVNFTYDWGARRRLDAEYKLLRKRVPHACLIFTYTGLFETRADWSTAKMAYANGTSNYAGFGHLGEAPAQLLLRSEDNVEALPNCGRTGKGANSATER